MLTRKDGHAEIHTSGGTRLEEADTNHRNHFPLEMVDKSRRWGWGETEQIFF